MSTAQRLLNETQTARYLGVSRVFLRKARMKKNTRGPNIPFVRLGSRAVRYDVQALNAWLDAQNADEGASNE